MANFLGGSGDKLRCFVAKFTVNKQNRNERSPLSLENPRDHICVGCRKCVGYITSVCYVVNPRDHICGMLD